MTCPRCGSEAPDGSRFCPSCGADLTGPSPVEERKVVSVLFVDIVGSTEHADGADPEDVRERNQLYYKETRERIERYGGVVEKYVGDAVMAVWGAPLARSDDAERAVRAALSVLEGVHALNDRHAGLDLEVRAAVCSGEAMVALHALPEDTLATGDVVNTAARLQSAAPVGRAIVGAETHRLTRHAFRFQEMAPIDAKGKREAVPAWLVEEAVAAPASRPTSRTPLIGRDRELTLIHTLWDRAVTSSRPHLVTVLGPAGMGKSRLGREVSTEIEGHGARALWGRSLPYEEQTPYRALGQIVRQATGIYENDPVDTARDKLAAEVAALFPESEAGDATRFLSLLLGLGLDEPASESIHLFFATRRFIEHLSEHEPLLVVFEDAHWADDSLLDLIEYLVTHVHDHRILFLALARPEFLESRPNWGAGMSGGTTLPLEPLTSVEAAQVIASLLADANASTVDRVVATAEGNPLFIEELVASLADDPASEKLPATVRAAISARIDALPAAARTALLHASVIGHSFWRGVLASIGELGDVDEALDALQARGLILRHSQSRVEGEAEFAFKHVLIRDTAYGTLPRATRRDLHAATARLIEASLQEPGELGWILAHHWREAGEPSRAITYLLEAAERARDALAVEQTHDLYTQALELAETDGERRRIRLLRGIAMTDLEDFSRAARELGELVPELEGRDEIEALLARGRATIWTEQTDETMAIAEGANELTRAFGDPELIAPALALLSGAYGMRGQEGDLDRALKVGDEALEAWVPGTRTLELAEHYHLQADHAYWSGQYEDGLELSRLESAAAGLDPHSAEFLLRGAGMEGLVLAGMGRYEEALAAVESAIATAVAMGRPANVVTNYSTAPLRDIFALEEAHRRSEEVAGRLGPSDFNMPWMNARADLIGADLLLGDFGRVERAWPSAWEDAQGSLAWERWLVSGRLCHVRGELALASEQLDDALTWSRRSLEMAESVGRKKYVVLSRTTLGRTLTASGMANEAVAELRTAIEIADVLGSPLYRWQTRTALAEALSHVSGGAAAEQHLEKAASIIREVAAALSPEHSRTYLAAPQVSELLDAVG